MQATSFIAEIYYKARIFFCHRKTIKKTAGTCYYENNNKYVIVWVRIFSSRKINFPRVGVRLGNWAKVKP